MRRAAKVDANQAEVVVALQKAGASVTSLAAVGGGVPDLLVSWGGRWYVLEVKDGARPPSRRRVRANQAAWHDQQRAEVHVVLSPEDALRALGMIVSPSRYALDNCS